MNALHGTNIEALLNDSHKFLNDFFPQQVISTWEKFIEESETLNKIEQAKDAGINYFVIHHEKLHRKTESEWSTKTSSISNRVVECPSKHPER